MLKENGGVSPNPEKQRRRSINEENNEKQEVQYWNNEIYIAKNDKILYNNF